jgi:hypothetical protein
MKKATRLLDEVRDVMRLHHYSIHTERAYCDWIKRHVLHHRMASREDLKGVEKKITEFLTHLVVEGHVAPSTQNQVMNALVFLYKKVLKEALEGAINAVRAPRKVNVPVVMTREEVAMVIPLLNAHPACRQATLWKRPAHDGSPSAEGAGYRFGNEDDHCAFRERGQGSRHDLPYFGPAPLANPPGTGQAGP